KEIQESLKRYVTLYQREHGGQLPNNMHIIYDYMLMAGDENWSATPVAVIATRDDKPLPVRTTAPLSSPPTPHATPTLAPKPTAEATPKLAPKPAAPARRPQ